MSKLSVDELNGRQTAGSITLSLENDNSQILQQGVVKATVSAALDGTVANADASLNISGVADGSAGLNTITVTNPFQRQKLQCLVRLSMMAVMLEQLMLMMLQLQHL